MARDTDGVRTSVPAVWLAFDRLCKDRMVTLQDLADEAFRDLLKKHHRTVALKEMLRESAPPHPANDHEQLLNAGIPDGACHGNWRPFSPKNAAELVLHDLARQLPQIAHSLDGLARSSPGSVPLLASSIQLFYADQGIFSLANERVHDSCGWFDVANEIDSFARKDHSRFEVVPFGGLSIALRLACEVLFEISLAPIPPLRESIS
jgi:hypothetical protein